MTDIVISQAGTWPTYQITLTRSGYPLPLAGAIVTLHATHSRYSGWTISHPCVVVDNGLLTVTFDPSETIHPGEYNATLTLSFAGDVATLPTSGSFSMLIGSAYDPDPVDRPPLKVYEWTGAVLSLKAVIDAYSYVKWTRKWREPGSFEAAVNRHATGATEILKGRFVALYRNGVYRIGRIETIEAQLTETGEASEDWVVSGREVGAVLEGRVCLYGTASGTGYDEQAAAVAETAMRHYVDVNAITTDAARVITGLALEAVDGEKGGTITASARFDTVVDVLKDCASQSGLGWRIDYEFDSAVWRFLVLSGTDRSASVLLSPRLGNALVSAYRNSIADSPSVAVVAGQGEAAARDVETVGTATGWDRRELFVDARDLDTTAALTARGESKLEELGEETTLELQYISTPMYRYGTDFDLGDIIQGEYPDVASVTARIVAVREEYPSGNISLTLGTEWPDLVALIKAQKKDNVVKRT